jgi:hypothetical protein
MVKLKLIAETYGRYGDGGKIVIRKASAPTLKEALLKIIDKVNLYIDSDSIKEEEEDEKREISCEEIIERMDDCDGCDFVLKLEDTESKKVYIENEEVEEDEDEDEDDEDED